MRATIKSYISTGVQMKFYNVPMIEEILYNTFFRTVIKLFHGWSMSAVVSIFFLFLSMICCTEFNAKKKNCWIKVVNYS